MSDGQEEQQKEHEEEMRARLRRSESIEKAAVSVLWIHWFIIFGKGKTSQLLARFVFVMIPLVITRRQQPSFPSAP